MKYLALLLLFISNLVLADNFTFAQRTGPMKLPIGDTYYDCSHSTPNAIYSNIYWNPSLGVNLVKANFGTHNYASSADNPGISGYRLEGFSRSDASITFTKQIMFSVNGYQAGFIPAGTYWQADSGVRWQYDQWADVYLTGATMTNSGASNVAWVDWNSDHIYSQESLDLDFRVKLLNTGEWETVHFYCSALFQP